jgi:hypothetical protein
MSYDLFVQNLPPDAKTLEDIPSDFKPASIGERSLIIEKIKVAVPDADFSDPSWGRIQGDDWSIEINMGANEHCSGFAIHIRGGAGAFGVVEAILQALKLRALDPQAGGFFVAGPEATDSFNRWRAYRDQVVNRRKS